MYEQNLLVKMFRTFMKVVLLVSNAGGAVIGGTMVLTGAIVLMLLELYVFWFSLTFVENVMNSLIVLGALVLVITALGALGTVYEGQCGRFIIILYAVCVLITTGIQMYVTFILSQYRQSKIDTVKFAESKNKMDIYKSNVTVHSLKNLPLFPGDLIRTGDVSHSSERNYPKSYEHIIIKRNCNPEHVNNNYSTLNEFIEADFISKKATEADKIMKTTENIVVPKAFSINLPGVISWFLPNILEPENNKYAMKLKPILGALSRPLLYISLKGTVMLLFYATGVWEILCFTIATYLCITKTENNENDKDIEEIVDENEEEAEEEEEELEEEVDAKKKI